MTWTDFFSALLIALLAGLQILQIYDADRKDHSIRQLENKLAKLEISASKEDHSIKQLENKLAKLESSTTKSLEGTAASLKQHVQSPIKDGSTSVVFLIDSSSSISDEDFKDSLAFVKNVPNIFGKNWDTYTYSILLFNETVHSQFIGQFENEQTLDNVVSRTIRVHGSTDIAYALRYVQSPGQTFSSFGPNTHKFLFIITDGWDRRGYNDIEKEADKLKSENGVHIFTIGVRNQWYNSVIEKISSTSKYYFHHFLDNIDMQKIKNAIHIVSD